VLDDGRYGESLRPKSGSECRQRTDGEHDGENETGREQPVVDEPGTLTTRIEAEIIA
jgi:hypothetical protein